MKTIRETLASLLPARRSRAARWLKPAMFLAFGLMAFVAKAAPPANDLFANAIVLTGSSGTTNGDNSLATLEPCELAALNTTNLDGSLQYPNDRVTNSVWFAWTAPASSTMEFDTAGSSFNTVLAVWTTTNGLCDPSLTYLIANDSFASPDLVSATNIIQAVAGTTYYISLNSFNDLSDPFDDAGAYVLNWNAGPVAIPSLVSGPFSFTASTYYVSQSDSTPPINQDGGTVGPNNTISPGFLGARITVTRPPPAYGRVSVDYAVSNLTYVNTFRTNFFGTNEIVLYQDTNNIISATNTYFTNIVVTRLYQSYAKGYQTAALFSAATNTVTTVYGGLATATSPVLSGALTPIPTNLPFTTNYSLPPRSVTAGGFTTTSTTNIFGLLRNGLTTRGTNAANGLTYTNGSGFIYTNFLTLYTNTPVTNYYGTNITIEQVSTLPNGPYSRVIYYFTNIAMGTIYSTNRFYTNGPLVANLLVSGTNWNLPGDTTNLVISILTASNYLSVASGGVMTPVPTNIPPLGGVIGQIIQTIDSSGDITLSQTNSFSNLSIGTQIVPSANGISLAANTITFDNFQMSKDIFVPLSQPPGPDAPDVDYIPGYALITLSNPQLDPQEDPTLITTPTIAGTTAHINALSLNYGTGLDPAYDSGPGIFNFERSTFRVRKNVNGTNAIISVNRYGTNVQDAVTVDYVIDPARTHSYPFGMNPASGTFLTTQDFLIARDSFTDGQANTFVLQAGSDYATPDSDYTPVSGTLSWGAFDNAPKQITIPILDNGLNEVNEDLLIQLHNPLPLPTTPAGMTLGEVNSATLTILFNDTTVLGGVYPGQQPAGAVDRSWNREGSSSSVPPNLQYPGTTPGNGGTVYAVAEQPDGRAIIAGSFVSYDSKQFNRIVRVLSNGYYDPTFQGNSPDLGNNTAANDFIAAVALQPDGRILIGGNFTSFNGYNRHYIARLNNDGSLDATFNPGVGANARIWSVTFQSDGHIIIGGEFTTYNGTTVNKVARLNFDGSLDTTFNPGAGPDGTVDAVAVDGLGRVIIGGDFANVSGVSSGGVARLKADGSLDTTFTPGIGTFDPTTFAVDPVHAIALQPDGKILIGGSFAYYNLANYNGLLRLQTDGTLDLNFQPGTGTLNPVTSVADTVDAILLQPDGNILIGGNFMSYNQTRRVGLARVFPDGSLDTSFMDTTYNQFAGVPNQYFNGSAVSPTYPYYNSRNAIYAIALETSSITSSNVIIGGTFGMVGGGSTRTDMRPRSNVARVIGGSTPGPGNMELSYNNYSVANSEGSLFVSLIRTNGNLGIVSCLFSVNTNPPGAGIAAAGTDFSPVSANPVWDTAWYNNAQLYEIGSAGPNYALNPGIGLGATTGNPRVTVNVFNPGNISGNLSANFGLSLPVSLLTLGGEYIPVGAALGVQSSAPFTIIDSNVKAGVLGFSSPVYTAVEGTTATITLTRTNGAANAVTVYYATTDGTATNGLDYAGATNQLSFGIGQTNATFTVAPPAHLHYTSIQPDKTVNLRLFSPGGGATLSLANAILTLVNPNYSPGHVSFSMTNYPVNENAGSAVITVNRLGGNTGTMRVTMLTSDGTATNGINYTGITTNLFWNDGDATARTITIPVRDDGVVTPDLLANLRLINSQVSGTNNSGPLTFGGTNATLTIVNVDSAGSFQFSSSVYAVKKYGSYALIPVMRTGGSIGTVSVSFNTIDDTALQGVNYTYTTNTLTFTNGELTKFVPVPVSPIGTTNDLTDLFLQLSNPTGLATLGTPNLATLYIINSDLVNETPGMPDTTYYPFAGFNNNVYALVLQTNNQLLAGGDFTMANGVNRNRIARLNSDGSLDVGFSLPSSSYGANASVRAIAVQTDGRILLGGFFTNFNSAARGHVARINTDGTLDNLFNPGSGADNPVYAIAQTFVNGDPKVLIGGSFASVSGSTFNSIAQLNNDGTPDATFNPGGLGANATVYALAVQPDGKIVIGGDFTTYNGRTNLNHIARLNVDGSADTNFNVGGIGPSASVRAIAIQLDGKIIIGGIFTNVNGVALNHIGRLNTDGSVDASFTPGIGANDAVFALGIQSDSRIVVGGEFTFCSGVTRNRITRLNPDGQVDPSINFGAGANDFVGAIAIQEDTIGGYPAAVPDEKIIIGGGFTQYFGKPHSHVARIFGGSMGGSGAFQFSSGNYSVDERGTNISISVWRTGGTTNAPSGGDIFITATASDGTAVAGINYSNLSPYLLDFPLGEVLKTFTIPVMDDGVVTNDLTVDLALSNPTSPAQIGNQPTAVLTIINDDTTISFSSATYSVAKNVVSGTAPISIIRQGGTSGTASVSFTTTAGGTATPVTDYTPVSQIVTFNPGVSNVIVYIPINNNGIPEGNRTVTMQIANANGSTLASPATAVLTIIDTVNAPGQLSFSSANYSIIEGGGVGSTNAYITVVRNFGSSGTVSVGFKTQDGTAQAGLKYLSTNGVLTFGDGETSKTFFVPVLNTATAEGPETMFLILTNATGGASLAPPAVATLTILNTNIGIAFVSAVNSFTEPSGLADGTALVNVIRYNNTNGTTTVNYSTTNGTAVANINFVGVTNATLTFNPGDSIKPIVITTRHDPRVTGDLFFTIGLANPTGSAQLTSPSYTVVVDHDADAGISFFTNATSVARNAGFVIIPVFCSNTNAEPVSVNYATSSGSAIPGTDYTTVSGTLSFTNGAAFNYFAVPILLNNAVQTNRTFSVTLSSPTPPGVLLQPPLGYPTETVTIIGTNTPPGLSFLNPIVISGVWGTTNADNTMSTPEVGDPNLAGLAPVAPVWFQWTAPPGGDGEVTLDTIGSVGITNKLKLDTVLAVFTGSSLSTLSQVAANDDLYPLQTSIQINEVAQNIFNTNAVIMTNGYTYYFTNFTYVLVPILFTNDSGYYSSVFTSYYQPFNGPSGLRFNAKAGTTYYIAADTKITFGSITYVPYPPYYTYNIIGLGNIQLNWAYHSSGVFRFATENVDQTGLQDTNGNQMLLYQCAESEGSSSGTLHRELPPPNAGFEPDTTIHAYYPYDTYGQLVTVTRVAGSSGRVSVDYATLDGDTNIIKNGDAPAHAGLDYSPVSGTLIFDDFEMSKTILIPIYDDFQQSQPNRDFMVVLSNPRRDPMESGNVSAPRIDPAFGQAVCRILDCDIDPKGPSTSQVVTTNVTFGGVTNLVTNTVVSLIPTNGIFNFAKANYRVPRDVQEFWTGIPVTVYVNRSGTNRSSVTLNYRFDNYFLSAGGPPYPNNEFPLQPGSDYAVPTPARSAGIAGTNSDFNGTDGTLSFPGGTGANAFESQPIHFDIPNNHLTEFNKDIHISLYESKNNSQFQDGMVAETTVTILFDDSVPPAGCVDQFYNPDLAVDMATLTNSLGSAVPNPGTDPYSEVYAVALTTNNETVIGGSFSTYSDSTNTYTVNGIARLSADGSLDTTFNAGSGINVFPGGEFIRALGLTSDNKVVIGGDFSSFNGVQRNNIARLNSNGSLDTTFNPGNGANGTVWSVLVQSDGTIMIGGEFTTYNGVPRNHVARLLASGALDVTFNPSNLLTGPVYAMTEPPGTVLSFFHSANGGPQEDVQTLNLGTLTSGTLTVIYDMYSIPDDIRIFYGTTNTAAGTGVLLFDSGQTNGSATLVLPFGPTGNLTANQLTIVMNQGGSTNSGTAWEYVAQVSVPAQSGLIVGGHFNVTGQSYANIASLNQDGSLDTSFNAGTGPDDSVLSLAWQLDSKIIAGGAFKNVSGVSANRLTRLNRDGSIDANFLIGTGADNQVNAITLEPLTGVIYVGGPFTMMNGTHRLGFTRLYPDGTVDTTFLDTAYNQYAGLPRILFVDAPGSVYSSVIQGDGNVIIGGSFQEVGGGQADKHVRYFLELERGLTPSTTNADLSVSIGGSYSVYGNLEPKSRDGVRNRSNVARLIGGATPGPGNIGMVSSSYAVNRTQSVEPVTLVRANGFLGYASANFSVLPGLAQSGVDYSYNSVAPVYPIAWEYSGPTRIHGDGLFGANGIMQDQYGQVFKFELNGPASVNVSIYNNTSVSGNLSAQFQMANPADADIFYLGGQNIPVGVALGISQAPLTVVDNTRQDGVFGFASPIYVATNSPTSVAIVRTNGSSGVVQLNYQTTTNGSTAAVNLDYWPTNGVITFASGQTSGSFPVTIVNNSYVTTLEKFVNVQLFNVQDLSGGAAQLGLTNAQVRIINPNFPGYLNFSADTYVTNLSAGAISFTVTRTVGSKGTLAVQYRTYDTILGVNGVDYVGSTNTLTWNNGDVTPRTVSIPLINNNTTGGFKKFGANLFNSTVNGSNTVALLGTITNAYFQIINDNSFGTFQFSSPSYQFNENGGYATLTVTRTGSALGTVTNSYATLDGTALAATNYVATNGTLIFSPGQLAKSFNVQLIDDGRTNPSPANFYFGVALTDLSNGGKFGSPSNSVVHIVDAESFNQSAGSVDTSFNPTAGMNASVLALALQSGGQIVAGGSFTVANGSTRNRLARLNTDGTLDNGFLNGLGGADSSVNALINQTDDRLVVGGAFAKINGTTRQRIARLMTDGTVDSSFNPGSGADASVFALAEGFLNGSRVIYAGGAFNTFNGNPSPGVVRLTGSGAVDGSFAIGQGANGTVYALAVYPTNVIYNGGKVLVGGLFTNFNGSAVANLVRLNPDGSLDTNFNQNVSANNAVRAIAIQLDGSVLIGGDFTNVDGTVANRIARLNADGTLDAAFTVAAAPGINGTVNAIAVQADNRIVVAGQFSKANDVNRAGITRLLLTGAVDPTINFGLGANGAVNALVIQPADGFLVLGGDFTQFNGQPHQRIVRLYGGSTIGAGAFQFTSPNYQIDETASFATITIQRTGGTLGTSADGSVAVAFTTTNGSAVAGVNYAYTTNYLVFPIGEAFQTIYVHVMDDHVITANLTVNLLLSNPANGAVLGDQASAVLTIINDDSTVAFQSASPTVPKNVLSGYANISIVRLGSTSGSCTVNFATGTNGSAVIGTDYYPTNALITFYPGDTNAIVQIPIINNLLPEGNRTVTMALTNALNSTLTSPSNATLTIIDTVQAPGNLFFVATNFTANASDGVAYLTVGRTNGTSGSVAVTYTTYPGTALPGFNYVSTTNTVTFNDGDTNKTFTVPLINNPVAQSAVSLTVSLSNPTGGAGLIAPTNATLTINNTNPVISFTLATNTVAENAGLASIVVQRQNNTNLVSTINYATTNGTAVAGVNYSNTFGTLTFGFGEAFKSISIPLINHSNATDLAFGVGLSSPTHAQLIAPSNTVVILQGSAAGISFTTNATTVQKNAGSVLITVVCSNPRVEPVVLTSNDVPLQVTYKTVDGTAKAGINYVAATGTLVFTNGNATNTFIVPLINNLALSGNETFSVILTNVTAPGKITPYGTEAIVIAESNAGMRFSQTDYSVFKDAGLATITVYRTGFTDSIASVDYYVTNGTALAGQNFYPTNGTLVFSKGITSQSFNVSLIANIQVQPNLFALLRLTNPTNSTIVPPGTATLTILETGGSYVVPAGAMMVTNFTSHKNDGIIGSNDTVQVLFAFRDSAGLSVTNLIATLLATNGVTPVFYSTTNYGPLTVYGHSVSRPFTFAANGTNTSGISPMFQLYDNGKYIGPAIFNFTIGAWTTTFANSNAIIINDIIVNGTSAASPYPSIINVSGVGNSLVKATVTLTNLSHRSFSDIATLVVSPTTNTLLMGLPGGNGIIVNHVTLTFDDAATNNLPTNAVPASGLYKPTQDSNISIPPFP